MKTPGAESDLSVAATPGEHKPYVPDSANLPEFTLGPVLLGSLLGIVFGASSLYLVLKVGLTVSASIPVAVLSITLFRVFTRVFGIRPASILENNIVQTAGSAGESIAFGVGATMPALMILGFEMDVGRVIVVAVLGGLLGILMMIPLRRAFIVHQHGKLKYPEGTACADVLIVGEEGGATAKTVFSGFGLAFVYKFLMSGLNLWMEGPSRAISWFKGATLAVEADPALLGVGYIIGTRTSCLMAAGGAMAWLVIAPAIHFFGDSLPTPLAPAKILISTMGDKDLRNNYVLYIGVGAVAAGGAFSLLQALPLIFGSLTAALSDFRRGSRTRRSGLWPDTASRQEPALSSGQRPDLRTSGKMPEPQPRTDRDLSPKIVWIGAPLLVAAIWATTPLHYRVASWIPDLQMNAAGALLIVLCGFLFVTVSSRLTGEIGSSSNPISGMTVATLLLTCSIFYALHMTSLNDQLTALSVAAVVCVAASNGGSTSQDLKTGYLVGATPRDQQWAILIGTLTSALVIGVILIVLNRAGTVYTTHDLPTPTKPPDVAQLDELETAPGDLTKYHVWRVPEANAVGVPAGKYLLDDAGQIRYLVDPGINGHVMYRDDGSAVQKFDAPKARLMAIIAGGILNNDRGRMPWALVLLGVFIAIVLELCGVSSLPFAVGVYLPLGTSMAVFAGGVVRWLVDVWPKNGNTDGNKPQVADSDMSPGVLLSTGYIAGATIAGVVIAFLSFSDTIPQALARWQYRQVPLAAGESIDEQFGAVAQAELGISGKQSATDEQLAAIASESGQIHQLNDALLAEFAPLKKGQELKLPSGKRYTVSSEDRLGQVAEKELGSADKAAQLLDLNKSLLSLPQQLPAGTLVKVPQRTWPAVAAFGAMLFVLFAVGVGWLGGKTSEN